MIYTIGRTEAYDKLFEGRLAAEGPPFKAAGGSVWETRESAQAYLDAAAGGRGARIEFRRRNRDRRLSK